MSKTKRRNGTIKFGIVLMLIGIVAIVVSLILLKAQKFDKFQTICLLAGCIVVVLLSICIIVGSAKLKRTKKPIQQKVIPEVLPDVEAKLDNNNSQVTYISSSEAQNLVNMGSYQSVEEKFEQIAKMDKTQFVIYIAKLFSHKGYQVKLTPVFDNHDVDLLVEKMGVVIAVGCIHTNKILGENDVRPVALGKQFYQASNVMALTNMFFDRTALDFAKANKMSLVDRVILQEDFMS